MDLLQKASNGAVGSTSSLQGLDAECMLTQPPHDKTCAARYSKSEVWPYIFRALHMWQATWTLTGEVFHLPNILSRICQSVVYSLRNPSFCSHLQIALSAALPVTAKTAARFPVGL